MIMMTTKEEMGVIAIPANNDDGIYTQIMKHFYGKRILVLNSDIDDDLLEYVCLSIVQWNLEDKDLPVDKRKRIKLIVCSLGGDTLSGDQIVSSIVSSVTPVDTICMTQAMSMASYILAAGKRRYCFENAVVLLHDGSVGYMGSANKGRDMQKFRDAMDERETQFLIDHTNMTAEFLDEIKDREYFLFADEAKERGLIDYIIGKDCSLVEAFE